MLLPDVNVLVYAHRADQSVHEPYREWLERVVSGAEPFALSNLVCVGFVRLVTNRRVFADATPLASALGVIDTLVGRSNCRVVGPGPEHWSHVAALCRATGATAKLVADAQHAAVALENGCTIVTRDGDFAKWDPLESTCRHASLSIL